MSKILRISDGNYKVGVKAGRTITLDTGYQAGNVVVTGDLIVQGTSTIVSSTSMSVKDNIIVINEGETGNGVTLSTSGIQVDRGNLPDTAILFDETISHFNPATATSIAGTFVFKNTNSTLVGIRTNSINTAGGDLALISQGIGTLTVKGTSSYHRNVFDYTAWDTNTGPLVLTSDPDAIPNTQAIVDYIDSKLFFSGTTSLGEGDTTVITYDSSESAGVSRVEVKIDGALTAQIDNTGLTINNISMSSSTISNNLNNLILTSDNLNVELNGYLNLDNQAASPAAVASTTKLYSTSTIGTGKSGIYFTNTTNTDELVSKNRALLFSIIF